jgi:hypothetical protein
MPPMVQVVGGFSRNGKPARGWIQFIPSRLWVVVDHIAWACLAPIIELDSEGQFAVLLTPVDTDAVGWYYTVMSDAGSWVIDPKGTKMQHLRDLVHQ